MLMLPEMNALNRIRLEDNLTYGELSQAIGIKGESTLYRLLRGINQPIDRNLFKIRKFLTAHRSSRRRKRSVA